MVLTNTYQRHSPDERAAFLRDLHRRTLYQLRHHRQQVTSAGHTVDSRGR